MPSIRLHVLLAALLTTSACDHMAASSQKAAEITKQTYNDSVGFWSDVFTYHPKPGPGMPQTRYCYQMQSDVVCYDSVQARSTSKLVGYQDGDNISWVQPGGGSLGASGGEPVAFRASAHSSNTTSSSTNSNAYASSSTSTVDVGTGSISSSNLPPPPKGFSR